MAVISVPEVQAWLETTKLTLASFDAELETVARLKVFGALGATYDTSGWTDANTTPALVRKVIAMYVAAWTYARQYSEEALAKNSYVTWLLGMADALLMGMTEGTVDLPEVPGPPTSSSPSFYPDDSTGLVNPEEAVRFTIGQVF